MLRKGAAPKQIIECLRTVVQVQYLIGKYELASAARASSASRRLSSTSRIRGKSVMFVLVVA